MTFMTATWFASDEDPAEDSDEFFHPFVEGKAMTQNCFPPMSEASGIAL